MNGWRSCRTLAHCSSCPPFLGDDVHADAAAGGFTRGITKNADNYPRVEASFKWRCRRTNNCRPCSKSSGRRAAAARQSLNDPPCALQQMLAARRAADVTLIAHQTPVAMTPNSQPVRRHRVNSILWTTVRLMTFCPRRTGRPENGDGFFESAPTRRCALHPRCRELRRQLDAFAFDRGKRVGGSAGTQVQKSCIAPAIGRYRWRPLESTPGLLASTMTPNSTTQLVSFSNTRGSRSLAQKPRSGPTPAPGRRPSERFSRSCAYVRSSTARRYGPAHSRHRSRANLAIFTREKLYARSDDDNLRILGIPPSRNVQTTNWGC